MEQVKTATTEHHRTAVLRHVMRKYDKVKLSGSDRTSCCSAQISSSCSMRRSAS